MILIVRLVPVSVPQYPKDDMIESTIRNMKLDLDEKQLSRDREVAPTEAI